MNDTTTLALCGTAFLVVVVWAWYSASRITELEVENEQLKGTVARLSILNTLE